MTEKDKKHLGNYSKIISLNSVLDTGFKTNYLSHPYANFYQVKKYIQSLEKVPCT